ncbi:hypothetical protein LPJ56_007330, partial [Coemansia sp. RSA 2599]
RNGGQLKLKKKQSKGRSGSGSDSQQMVQEDNPVLFNTEGVINPYTVLPPSLGRLFVVQLPLSLLAAAGLYKQQAVEEQQARVEGEEDEALRQAVDSAIQSADDSSKDPFVAAHANQRLVDPEKRAKKAAKKAAKMEARRRRTPLV